MCMKPEDSYIYGNYDTSVGRLIRVFLDRCTKTENNCKSKEEINDFITGKYLTLLTNMIRFDSNNMGKESIVEESRLSWIPISKTH